MMTCGLCEKEINEGYGVPSIGLVCKGCGPKAGEQRKSLHTLLLEQALEVTPDELDLGQFETFALKFSLHALRDMSPKTKEKFRKNCPLLLVPEEFALVIKEKILDQIPLNYVSSQDAVGHERLFHGGAFQFKRKLPKDVLFKALVKAKLLKGASRE